MKNILIALTGLSPQVVTETIYSLYVKEQVIIDEVILITTNEGKNRVMNNNVVNHATGEKVCFDLSVEIEKLSKLLKIPLPKFKVDNNHVRVALYDNIEIDDVSSNRQAKAFPEELLKLMRKVTTDEYNTIHCSISGGRKTMSFYMGMALSFFGRSRDRLWHVVASKEFESSGKYFPNSRKDNGELYLSEIPYVRLRAVLAGLTEKKGFNNYGFGELVQLTQKLLKQSSSPKLKIDRSTHYIIFGENRPVKISPTELILYEGIINNKQPKRSNIHIDELSFLLWEDTANLKKYQQRILTYINKLNAKIEQAVIDIDYIGKYRILGPRELKEGEGIYGISAEQDDFIFMKD